jgi:hypothetical protein
VIMRGGIHPVLDEAAAQVRPATLDELHTRFPGMSDDDIADRLTERAAKTAGAVALAIGGIVAAQEAAVAATAAVPPAAGATLGVLGVTALAEVLVLFMIEAKLRADLRALAGLAVVTPRELASAILGEVQAAGGWTRLRRRSLRRALPEAATRRAIARIVPYVPARFARIVIPEVIAPLVGAVWASRLATKQVRAAGHAAWLELRGPRPSTVVTWGSPAGGPIAEPAAPDGEARQDAPSA